ncbi:MAG: protein adenylyltransferase SelO [Paludibacter sp.]
MLFNFKHTYTQLPEILFSDCLPDAVSNPQLVAFNPELASQLQIDTNGVSTDTFAQYLSGNKVEPNSRPIAQAYSGHQFGQVTRLGDGRAILLGELTAINGQLYDVQLKGAGITPYSRRGDGRATLSAMLREYIISEAMYALRIPTTRSLAVVATGEPVYRQQVQMGAVLTRIAASHIRVGTFEHAARFGNSETIQELIKYTIQRHYPKLNESRQPALDLLEKVMEQQIALVLEWMRVGFIHGVMNTDNMTLSGETIDYGPCAFMNTYNPETVFSSIDTGGRYAFGKQPEIALWNITRLAESLLKAIHPDTNKAIAEAEQILSGFSVKFEKQYFEMMGKKLGLENLNSNDKELITELLNWMYINKADYTNTFLQLMYPTLFDDAIYRQESFLNWKTQWGKRIGSTNFAHNNPCLQTMQQNNPTYIPRNHKVEEVLQEASETGNMTSFSRFMQILAQPYSTQHIQKEYCSYPTPASEASYKTYCGT